MTKPNSHIEQMADVLVRIEDLKVEVKSIIDDAKASGMAADQLAALKSVAAELVMPPDKLAKKIDRERQRDLFRDEVKLFKRKGLVMTEAAL